MIDRLEMRLLTDLHANIIAATATSSLLSDCLLPEHEGVKAWKFRDVLKGVDLPTGTSVSCLAAQPGACLVTASPSQ